MEGKKLLCCQCAARITGMVLFDKNFDSFCSDSCRQEFGRRINGMTPEQRAAMKKTMRLWKAVEDA